MGLRDFDSYSKPVWFTYKGKSEFDTSVGGIFSIITSLLMFFYGSQQLLFLFIKPQFSSSSSTTYVDFSTNSEHLVLNQKDTTIALKMTNMSGEDFDIESIARI